MSELSTNQKAPLARLILACADDKLILGHRNSDWTGLAPILEEDIAFSSLAQDEMAHAQALYEIAGELLGKDADELAFGREAPDFLCAQVVEVPDDFDWSIAIARQFFCDHFDLLRLSRMAESSYKPLADLAKRLVAEERVHVEHVDSWIQHLGRGTEEANARLQQALNRLATLAPMLFEIVDGQQGLTEAGVYPGCGPTDFEKWSQTLMNIASRANLTLSLKAPSASAKGGRHGAHTEHLKPLLDEMCEVYRIAPGAKW